MIESSQDKKFVLEMAGVVPWLTVGALGQATKYCKQEWMLSSDSKINMTTGSMSFPSSIQATFVCKSVASAFRFVMTLLVQQWEQLEVKDGLLYRRYENEAGNAVWLQLVVLKSLRDEILQELHGGVVSWHLGEEKTLGCLKERFYWPGHGKDVSNWYRMCI